MISFLSWRNARDCLLGAIGIYALCMIGGEFNKIGSTVASPLWPSSGLALALLVLRGWRLFPAITFGTIAATQSIGVNPIFSVAGSLGNTLESLTGWYLMTKVFDFSIRMERVRDVMIMILAGSLVGTLLNAIICMLGLMAIGAVTFAKLPLSLVLFWTGNVLGIIVFTPMILHLAERRHRGNTPTLISSLGWFLLITGIVLFGFANKTTAHTGLYPVAYLSFPILVWLALSVRHDVTVAVALVTTMVTAFTSLGYGPLVRFYQMATYGELTVYIIVFSITCLLIMATEAERMTSAESALENRLAAVRSESGNRAIRASLNSHFLFNSLNVIKSLIGQDEAKARDAVVGLSQLLRSCLRITRSTMIPLSEEMKVIRSYLNLQAIRYGDHLSLSVTIGPDVHHLMVPPMLFHQLVENAFKHGVDELEEKCFLAIRAERDGNSGDLRLSVTNSGRLGQSSLEGLGLGSIREQLASLYGKPASFTITQEPHDLVLAVIRIPIPPSDTSGISEVSGNSVISRIQAA